MLKSKNQGIEILDGYSLLMLRAEEGNYNDVLNVVNTLKPSEINAVNKRGYSALALAVKNGSYDIIELLISKGANVNIKNNSGQTPLFIACSGNNVNVVRLLLANGGEINTADQRGWSPLTMAAYHGNPEIVETLLQNNADVFIRDSFGKRASHRAKDPKIARMIQAAEASANSGTLTTIASEKNLKLSLTKSEFMSMPVQQSGLKTAQSSSVSELPEKKKPETTPSARKVTSPRSPLNRSPSSKMPLNQKIISWQDAPKTKKTNRSFEQNNNGKSSPSRRMLTSRITESSEDPPVPITKSPKAAEKPVRNIDLMNPPVVQTVAPTIVPAAMPNNKDIDEYINTQMNGASERLQELIDQKISLEVAKQIQEYQAKLRQSLESIYTTKITQSFKDLEASFNDRLKPILAKLDPEHKTASSLPNGEENLPKPKEIVAKEDALKFWSEKDVKAMEVNAQKLEKNLSFPKAVLTKSKTFVSKKEVESNSKGKSLQNFGANTQLATKNKTQINKKVKDATDALLTFSKQRISAAVQNETKPLHDNFVEEMSDKIGTLEEEAKKKIENTLAARFMQLSGLVENTSSFQSEDPSEISMVEESFLDSKSPTIIKTEAHSPLRSNNDSSFREEGQSPFASSESPLPLRPNFPKVDRLKIPESKFSQFKILAEKEKERNDFLREEGKIMQKSGSVSYRGDYDSNRSGMDVIKTKKLVFDSRRDDEPSSNEHTPTNQRGDAFTLGTEYKLEGLKHFYGKAAGIIEGKPKLLFHSNSSGSFSGQLSARSQKETAHPVPGHAFTFKSVKAPLLQYDFSND